METLFADLFDPVDEGAGGASFVAAVAHIPDKVIIHIPAESLRCEKDVVAYGEGGVLVRGAAAFSGAAASEAVSDVSACDGAEDVSGTAGAAHAESIRQAESTILSFFFMLFSDTAGLLTAGGLPFHYSSEPDQPGIILSIHML